RQGDLPGRLAPLWVGPGHVADQGAVRPRRPVEEERQVGGEGQPIDLRHEQAKAVLLDEVVELGPIGFGEMRRDVHRRRAPDGGNPSRLAVYRRPERQSRKATLRMARDWPSV